MTRRMQTMNVAMSAWARCEWTITKRTNTRGNLMPLQTKTVRREVNRPTRARTQTRDEK